MALRHSFEENVYPPLDRQTVMRRDAYVVYWVSLNSMITMSFFSRNKAHPFSHKLLGRARVPRSLSPTHASASLTFQFTHTDKLKNEENKKSSAATAAL